MSTEPRLIDSPRTSNRTQADGRAGTRLNRLLISLGQWREWLNLRRKRFWIVAIFLVAGSLPFLFGLAIVTLAISVVSFPLVLDRKVDAPTAIITSVRAVIANPIQMAAWGLIVAIFLVAGSLPFLFGLAIVMPILGHATWHLYRKVVG